MMCLSRTRSRREREAARGEVELLTTLDSPYIVRLVAAFQGAKVEHHMSCFIIIVTNIIIIMIIIIIHLCFNITEKGQMIVTD